MQRQSIPIHTFVDMHKHGELRMVGCMNAFVNEKAGITE